MEVSISYQPGDEYIIINEKPYSLRLTLGALAQISETLDTHGPIALSRQMKQLTPDMTVLLLRALLRPKHGHVLPLIGVDVLSPDILSKMAKIFERGFSDLKIGEPDERRS